MKGMEVQAPIIIVMFIISLLITGLATGIVGRSTDYVKQETIDVQADRVINTALATDSMPEGAMSIDLSGYAFKVSNNKIWIKYRDTEGNRSLDLLEQSYESISGPNEYEYINETLTLRKRVTADEKEQLRFIVGETYQGYQGKLEEVSVPSGAVGGGSDLPSEYKYCSKPSEATVIDSSNSVDELKDAVETADPGETIWIKGGTFNLNDHTEDRLEVPEAVEIVGTRGCSGSDGALITNPDGRTGIATYGPDVTIAGLRIKGPQNSWTIASNPWWNGIKVRHTGAKIYNNEIFNWVHAGVVVSNKNAQASAYIHHNTFHHFHQDEGSRSLGYGVAVYENAEARIKYNFFDYFRHAIASDGYPGTGYEASYNLFGENLDSHVVDVHGYGGPKDGTPGIGGTAGQWFNIHHNVFPHGQDIDGNWQRMVGIRGEPQDESQVHNNWIKEYSSNNDRGGYAIYQLSDEWKAPPYKKMSVNDNYWSGDNPCSENPNMPTCGGGN
jgi:hypothetical protein